jgi:hypothetical protein
MLPLVLPPVFDEIRPASAQLAGLIKSGVTPLLRFGFLVHLHYIIACRGFLEILDAAPERLTQLRQLGRTDYYEGDDEHYDHFWHSESEHFVSPLRTYFVISLRGTSLTPTPLPEGEGITRRLRAVFLCVLGDSSVSSVFRLWLFVYACAFCVIASVSTLSSAGCALLPFLRS